MAVDPVGAGHDPLGDQAAAVGEHEALEQVAGPAGRDQRLVLGDLAEPRDEPRVEQDTAAVVCAPGAGARRGRVGPVPLDAPVAQLQVVALAHRRAVIGDALEPERDAGGIHLRRPLDEAPGAREPRCEELGRPLGSGDPGASAGQARVEQRVVRIEIAQRREVAG